MAHTINLTKNHQRILAEALSISMDIKKAKLKNPDSRELMIESYLNVAEKILAGTIDCGRQGHGARDNVFGWIRDQLLHSRNLPNTEFGKLAISICEAAGNDCYDEFCQITIINRLFE